VPDGDPLNPAANGELGASGNKMFGSTPPPVRLDPAAARGFGVRPAQWEFRIDVEQAIDPAGRISVGLVRRVYTNFTVVDDVNLSPADYDGPYCIAAPIDARLPGGGAYPLCGLFDLRPAKTDVAADTVVAPAARYGREYAHWTGFQAAAVIRAGRLRIEGGIDAGKSTKDDCDVVARADNPSPLYCHTETPFVADLKLSGVSVLPWRTRLGITAQSSPGVGDGSGIAAILQYRDLPGLGRATSAPGGIASVNLIAPGSRFGDRVNQMNARFAKAVAVGGCLVDFRLDIYNVFNAGTTITWNNAYGTAGSSLTWLAPESIMQGRLVELGVRLTR
jgi:hypothetical protein